MQGLDDFPAAGAVVIEEFTTQWEAWRRADTFRKQIVELCGSPDERIARHDMLDAAVVAARSELEFFYNPTNQTFWELLPSALPEEESSFFKVQEAWRNHIFALAASAGLRLLEGIRSQEDKEKVSVGIDKQVLEGLTKIAYTFVSGMEPDAIGKAQELVAALKFWFETLEEGALSKKVLAEQGGGENLEFIGKASKMASSFPEVVKFAAPELQTEPAMAWLDNDLKTRLESRLASTLTKPLEEHDKVVQLVTKFIRALKAALQEQSTSGGSKVPPSLRPKRCELQAAAKALPSQAEGIFLDIEAGLSIPKAHVT